MNNQDREKSKEVRKSNMEESKASFLDILDRSAGNISVACKQMNIARSTFYSWMTDTVFAVRVKEIEESLVDLAETSLMKQIRDGNTTAIIFYLKCKGKKRGYTERLEIGTDDENSIKIEIVDARTTN
jgi:hypothetical protein